MNEHEPRPSTGLSVVSSLAGIVLVGMLATVPGSPFRPELAPGVGPGGPLRWLADLVGLDALGGNGLVAAGVAIAVFALAAFLAVLREAWRGRISVRTVVLLAVVAHVVVLLAPVVFSRDVYSYIAYGRVASVYHANPYVQTPMDFSSDAIFPLVGHKWVDTPAVYGPAFTALSGVLTRAIDSIPALVTAFRLLAIAASLGTVALIAGVTGRRWPERAAFAVAAFGLNPVILFPSVGGGHNDLLLALGVAGAFALVLAGRDLAAVVVLALAALVKASAALPLLLLLVWIVARTPAGRRARVALVHGGVAAAIGVAFAAPFWQTTDPTLGMGELAGHEGWLAPSRLVRRFLDWASGDVLGVVGRIGFALLLAYVVALLARAVWREAIGRADPIQLGAAWGWSLALLMLLGPVLLPWYVAWSLPLVWLLPRILRFVLVGTAALLAVSQWVTEPTLYPGAYDANILVGHYVLTPLVVVGAVWAVRDLLRRGRGSVAPLADEQPAREVPAAAR